MRVRVSFLLTGMAALTLGCFGPKGDDPVETDEPTPDDSRVDSEEPVDTVDTGDDPGETFEVEDPAFTVVLDGAEWKASGGFWFSSFVKGEVTGNPSYTVDIEVDGDLSSAGTYAVKSIAFSELTGASEPVISKAFDPDMTLTVHGYSEPDESKPNLFATLEGTADMSGGAEHRITSGEFRNWPKF